MMKLELIPFELAVKIQNKRFERISSLKYPYYLEVDFGVSKIHKLIRDGVDKNLFYYDNNVKNSVYREYEAPEIDLVLKWLREKYKLIVQIDYGAMSNKFWYYILDMNKDSCIENGCSSAKNSYEEAQLAGIEEALELI